MLWWSLNRTCHFTSSLLDNVRSYHLGEIKGESDKVSYTKISCIGQACNVRGRSQLSTFMKAYRDYARGEGVWDHCTLFS